MRIFEYLEPLPNTLRPATITIGNFDGVHMGHQAVFKELRRAAQSLGGSSLAITFKKHPSNVLRPDTAVPQLTTSSHKLKLLSEEKIDLLYHLTFDLAFSKQSAEQFIYHLHALLGFKLLILGHDAAMGHNRQGDKKVLLDLAQHLKFAVTYLPPTSVEGMVVSSSQIRRELQAGHLAHVSRLLGRHYSIYDEVIFGSQKGRLLGFPTANFNVSGLALPPSGVWTVNVVHGELKHPGIANLGFAPTLHQHNAPLLEVHLLDASFELYGQKLEVIFNHFIRPEKKFDSQAELKDQIQRDVEVARAII